MTRFFLATLLLIPASVLAQSDRDNTVRRRDPEPPAKFWLRRYPVRRFAALRHVDLETADFERTLAQVRGYIEKLDGAEDISSARDPRDTVKYQQFAIAFDRKNADKFIKRLSRMGKVRRDTQVEILHPEIPGEAATKLAQLQMERRAAKESLNSLFSVRSVIDELLDHLKQAVDAYEGSKDRVLVNLTVEQKAR
ncbi:MAG: hypothetical protein CO113_10530 [Elusimicrobia bacterium CG_4_9_14_3_um_filter_62_55]|nr:MAG: hypothetical protein COR54_20070 [Elusimicrobia bacterium CG22_combo_CG10-13_8_21_14_all_63_91]PJA17062.1 MAG: hypothetical protein COX66_06040 [Elusimicrobia bacterium CG_4_10_14_0_2_um_filter_63_34]PJB25093.1 MAG: hypothetical protein CO113_10530 [Elusimicrobia bacterium CG_4_9_14_3_um_filter_62_55]